jgi:hypothetical protein
MEYQTDTKQCQNCKKDFIIEPDDFLFYEKIKVPPPTFCWECRHQRRLSFRNERMFYKRKCDLCGESVVSRVSPDKEYKMYCTKCWWSDKWDPESYGKEYDFSRPFFEQWKDLFFNVPHISILNSNSINSDWVNQESDDKNCYLNVGGIYNEDSSYNTYELYGKDCFDNYWILNSEHCSNNIKCERGYFVNFSYECYDCLNTNYCYDCKNCNNIIACAGLRNKQYCIFNEQYSKDGFNEYIIKHPLSSHSGSLWWKEKSKDIWINSPHRENTIFKAVDSTGNDLIEVKNSHNCFQGTKFENSKNIFIAGWVKDSYDCSCFGAAELTYECAHSGGAYNSKALLFCLSNDPLKKMTINNVEYSAMTTSLNDCFGCVGIHGSEYMILNRRYSKEEYNLLVPKIKQHMTDMPYYDSRGREYKYGEFFPSEFSPFGYNETVAEEYIKLEKEKALEEGFNWNDYNSDVKYNFSDYIIPDDIKDVGDDILDKILKCEETGKAYKIIPMELSFCKQAEVPIPRKSPLFRHKERVLNLLPFKLFQRECMKCRKKIKTSYSPERPEIVYCEKCYQQEVY